MKKSTILTYFTTYTPYFYTGALGKITPAQAHFILSVLANHKFSKTDCIKSLDIKYIENTTAGFSQPLNSSNGSLSIENIFYTNTVPKCACKEKLPNDKHRINCCIDNLQSGKCTDQLMQKTFGIILFPQFYSEQQLQKEQKKHNQKQTIAKQTIKERISITPLDKNFNKCALSFATMQLETYNSDDIPAKKIYVLSAPSGKFTFTNGTTVFAVNEIAINETNTFKNIVRTDFLKQLSTNQR